MKSRFKLTRLKAAACLGGIGLCVVAWSPSGSDKVVELAPGATTNATNSTNPTVIVGNNNVVDGSTSGVTSGRGIVVGLDNTVGSATVSTVKRYSVVIGEGNTAVSRNTIVAGYQNQLTPDAGDYTTAINHSAVFGLNNKLLIGGNSALLVGGSTNTIYHANTSFIMGTGNSLGGSEAIAKTYNSAAIGNTNKVSSTAGWAMGYINDVAAENGVAIGTGTKTINSRSTALGRFNSPMETNDVVVVGTGTNDTTRNTALRVTDDGGVILGRAQGDISMGIYN